MEKLLLDESDIFSKNNGNIGTIASFKLKLNVTDPKPVWKPYRTIPKQLIPKENNTWKISLLITGEKIHTWHMQVRWFASEKKTAQCDFVLITGN